MASNLDQVKAAYAAWHDSKGMNKQPFLDMCADDVVFESVVPRPLGLAFAGSQNGKQMLGEYLDAIVREWTMRYYRVDALFENGDEIAMFGECSYTFKKNGKPVSTPIANLWTFRDGKVVKCVEIFDSAKVMEVASSM